MCLTSTSLFVKKISFILNLFLLIHYILSLPLPLRMLYDLLLPSTLPLLVSICVIRTSSPSLFFFTFSMEIQHNRMLSVDQSVQVNSNVSDAERFALESKSRSVSIKLLNVADDDEEDDTVRHSLNVSISLFTFHTTLPSAVFLPYSICLQAPRHYFFLILNCDFPPLHLL